MRHLLAAFALTTFATAASADDLAARFAARPAAISVALSPDGNKVVYIGAYKTGGRAVTVADLKTGETNIVMASSRIELNPVRCGFKSETRLICTLYGVMSVGANNGGFTRVVAIDTDGKNLKLLTQRTGILTESIYNGGSIRDWLADDPDHIMMQVEIPHTDSTGTLVKGPAEGTSAALVDIHSGGRRIIERSSPQVIELGSDGHGSVRFRATADADADGYVRDKVAYTVRAKTSREWRSIGSAALSDFNAPSFEGFDTSGDHIYELMPLDGRKALYAVTTDGAVTRTLVFAHPSVDVDGVLRIGKYRRPVGATYAIDRNEITYFDPELAALSRSLTKALPGHPDVSILDESWDGTKKLVHADGDDRPGRYYLYDTAAKKLGELMAVYPALDGVALGTVKAVSYAARDGTMIPGFLTLPPGRTDAKGLPGLVLPHGGPSARDTAGFDWLPQFFAAKGFAVLQPNFRGSSGYGSDFFAHNGFQSWQLAIGDVNDGARWLVSRGAEANKLVIFGWSYGGYAALQANVAEPKLYRAVVAVAPVTDLPLLRNEAQRSTDLRLVTAMIGDGPHVMAGSPARNAAKIVAPVLMFHADKDLNVDIEQSRTMASALRSAGRKVELIEYKGLDHQIDDSAAREDLLTRSAAFLKAAID